MSLFSKLQRLISDGRTQLEDFHTEIVAHVLRNDPDLTLKWLADLGFTERDKPNDIFVSTQEEFDPLETHGGFGSRPDISIRLVRGNLGYYMGVKSLTDYPMVGVEINVNPKADARSRIVLAMQNFGALKKGTWKIEGLVDERNWGSIHQKIGLQEFLAEEDHMKKITGYFNQLLDDVAEFRKRYPKLPWIAKQVPNEDE